MSAVLVAVVGAVSALALWFYCGSQKDAGRARSGIDPIEHSESHRMDTLRNTAQPESYDEWGRGGNAERDLSMNMAERDFARSQAPFSNYRGERSYGYEDREGQRGSTYRGERSYGYEDREEQRESTRSGPASNVKSNTARTSEKSDRQISSGREGRRRRRTFYKKETYDRNVIRSRTTPNVDHSPVPEMPHSTERSIQPIENPQVHTFHNSVDEGNVDRGFRRSEKSEEHMEKEEHGNSFF
ncbi:hypothetical protein GCK32_015544 [Trichostrongylus colubriformis]|uniref:Uncharacterized protein n=1 Tax=Trichostrongylus colubriformis TaxID=6319 RepID=A0AAN8FZB7_TRICO